MIAKVDQICAINTHLNLTQLDKIWQRYQRHVNSFRIEGGYSLSYEECQYLVHDLPRAQAFVQRFRAERYDLLQLLSSLAILSRATTADKCRFLFQLFDLDEEEEIVQAELQLMIRSVCSGLFYFDMFESEPSLEEIVLIAAQAFAFCALEFHQKMTLVQFTIWFSSHGTPLSLLNQIT